ncbi:hypothetical protein UlMin_032440 [Ulmus minor]
MLRCVECDFSLHLLCGRLPSFIKHEYHVHLFTLVDSLIEDDSEEYYCDICEEKRDPRICIYYCAECRYMAHVNCVISKIVEVLEGDIGDVKLITVGEWNNMAGEEQQIERATHDGIERKETLKDLISELSEDETEKLKQLFDWNYNDNALQIERFGHLQGGEKHDQEDSDSNEEFYADDEFLRKFRKRFYDPNEIKKIRLKLDSSELDLKLVNVEGFKIPQTLAPVLKDFIAEYGNIFASHRRNAFSPAMRNIIYFIICRLVNSICRTRVIDITEDLLLHWNCQLYFVWVTLDVDGISFLVDTVWELFEVYMGLQIKRRENDWVENLPKKIEKLREKLNKYEEQLDQVRANKGLAKSDEVKKCLEKASQFHKWKTARNLLFRKL